MVDNASVNWEFQVSLSSYLGLLSRSKLALRKGNYNNSTGNNRNLLLLAPAVGSMWDVLEDIGDHLFVVSFNVVTCGLSTRTVHSREESTPPC